MPVRSSRHRALSVASILALASACKPHAHAPPEPAHGRFSIHEWGLVAVDIATPAHADLAAGTLHGHPSAGSGGFGTGSGYKPVLYVHLDEGVREARLSLAVGIGADHVPEHFPPASLDAAALRFGPIRATRGACVPARLLPVPTPDSRACQTADGFCEAAEIPRYTGERDVCLSTHGQTSELLFYRARGLDLSALPLTLAYDDGAYVLRRAPNAAIAGPVLFITNAASGPTLRVLPPTSASGPIDPNARTISSGEARALLLGYARSLGLANAEAEAMIDAWAPAIFDTCHRSGAEASGTPPTSLLEADNSLLYFAPRALVDAVLPLTTDPPAHAIERAFLIRVVDSSRPTAIGGYHSTGLGSWNPAVVRLRNSSVAVRGPLSRDQVRRVVLRNISQLQHCYEVGLQEVPDLAGYVTLEFTIGPEGSATQSHVEETTLDRPSVERCLSGAVRRWAFPVVEGAMEPTVASMPFVLAVPSTQ